MLRCNTEGQNIQVFAYGIGNADKQTTFAAQGTSWAASFVESVTAINQHYLPAQAIECVPVTMRKLDTIMASEPPPSLVKIDIEGFELEALKGSERLLSVVRPKLLVEIHPKQLALSGGSEDEVFNLLRQQGYKWSVIDRNPNSLYTILAGYNP